MSNYVTLPGSIRTLLPKSRPAGPVDRSEMASLTIRVKSTGDLKGLENQVHEESGKPLDKRTYLSRRELAENYDSEPSKLQVIEEYAQRHNLVVVHRSAAERSVVLKGRLGDLLDAFPADVHLYHHSSGTYRARQGSISIPEELKEIVTGVFGFDTRPRHRSPHRSKLLSLRACRRLS